MDGFLLIAAYQISLRTFMLQRSRRLEAESPTGFR